MSEAGPQVNGLASPTGKYIDHIDPDDPAYIKNLQRPAEVKEDLQQMENRSRVKLILNSQAFKEELEQVVEEQLHNGPFPASLIALQQITDLLLPHSKGGLGSLARASAVIPINDLRGVESLGFAKGEKLLRCKLAALYRLVDLCGWSHGIYNHISARVSPESEQFLLNPFGLTYSEVTASSLIKVDVNGDVVDPGSTHLGSYKAGFSVHAAIHQARPDIKCIVHLHTPAAVAVSALKCGLLPMSQEALVCGNISYHDFQGLVADAEERQKLARNLGVHNKILILRNRGILACGETVEEAFHYTFNVMAACEIQVKAIPLGLDNIVIPSEEAREQAHKKTTQEGGGNTKERKWKTGELEFEALMRSLDNSGYRTGYAYKMPVVKQEKKDRSNSDVEIPPSSSSFTYIFDGDYVHSKYASPLQAAKERQKNAFKAGWMTTPNAYKKTEIEEIGTTTPKKITKWVTEGDSPNKPGSIPIRIDNPNQFAPQGDNPKEYKQRQKSIRKDYYEEKVTAGPQSKILEGITWDEVQKTKDGQLIGAGDQLIVVGAASKGIIQRDHQHNAVLYRQFYAANPFENMSESEIEQYRAEVQRKERGEPAFEEEISPPSNEATTFQQPQEFEKQDTEVAEQTRPEQATNELLKSATPAQSPTGHHTSCEEKLLTHLTDKDTLSCDTISVEQKNQEQLTVTGADLQLKLPNLSHAVGSHILNSYFEERVSNNRTQVVAANSEGDEDCIDDENLHSEHSNRAHTNDLNDCDNLIQGRCFEASRGTEREIKEHVSKASDSEDECVTIQLNPIHLYHGQRENGIMKVRFSIQSTVRRRIRAEVSRGGTIEEVYASISEPSIEHFEVDDGGFEHSDMFVGHDAHIDHVSVRKFVRRVKQFPDSRKQQPNLQHSGNSLKNKTDIISNISGNNETKLSFWDHSQPEMFPDTEYEIDNGPDGGGGGNTDCRKPDLSYQVDSFIKTEEIVRLNSKLEGKVKQTPNGTNIAREEKRSDEHVTDVSVSENKTVSFENSSVTAEYNNAGSQSAGLDRGEETSDQVAVLAASPSGHFSDDEEDDIMYADEGLDEDFEPVKEQVVEKLEPTEKETKADFQHGEGKKRKLDRKHMPPPPLPPILKGKNVKSKKMNLKQKIVQTYPPLSPVKEEFSGTVEEIEEMEAILEEVDDSFEQLLISAEDDLLVSPKTDQNPRVGKMFPADFVRAAPMALEEDFDFEETNAFPKPVDNPQHSPPGNVVEQTKAVGHIPFRVSPSLAPVSYSEFRLSPDTVSSGTQQETELIMIVQTEDTIKDSPINPSPEKDVETIAGCPLSEIPESKVDYLIPLRKRDPDKAIASIEKKEIKVGEVITRKMETNSDIPSQKSVKKLWKFPKKIKETCIDDIIPSKKTEINKKDSIISSKQIETDIDDIIPSDETDTDIEDNVPSDETDTDIDDIIPSTKKATNIDIFLSKKRETDIDDTVPSEKTDSDDIIPSKEIETDIAHIIPSKKAETDIAHIIPSKKTETDIDHIIPSKKTETDIDHIVPSKKTETDIDDIIPPKKTETDIDQIIPSKKSETDIDDIIPSKKSETDIDDIIPSKKIETDIDHIIPSKKSETYLDHIIPSKKTETDIDDIIPSKKTEKDIDDIIMSKIKKVESPWDSLRTPEFTTANAGDVSIHRAAVKKKKNMSYINKLNIDEGPVQTSSPKMGRAKSKESPFKPYLQKLGKSEETLLDIMPLQGQKPQISAKSHEELEGPGDDDSLKAPLSRSKSLGPHHIHRKKQKQAATSPPHHTKSKETLCNDFLDSESPGKESLQSPKVVLDEHTLMKHCEMMKFSNPISIFKPPPKMDSPVAGEVMSPLPDTTEVPSVSDNEDYNQPRLPSSTPAIKGDYATTRNITSTESSNVKRKWVPKQKVESRRRRRHQKEEPENILPSGYGWDETDKVRDSRIDHDTVSHERLTGRQTEKRNVNPSESKRDSRRIDERENKHLRRDEEVLTVNNEAQRTNRDYGRIRRNEQPRKKQEDDHGKDKKRMDSHRDYEMPGRNENFEDDDRNREMKKTGSRENRLGIKSYQDKEDNRRFDGTEDREYQDHRVHEADDESGEYNQTGTVVEAYASKQSQKHNEVSVETELSNKEAEKRTQRNDSLYVDRVRRKHERVETRRDTKRDEQYKEQGESKDRHGVKHVKNGTKYDERRQLKGEDDRLHKSEESGQHKNAKDDSKDKWRHKDHLSDKREIKTENLKNQAAEHEKNVHGRNDRSQIRGEEPYERRGKNDGNLRATSDKDVSKVTGNSSDMKTLSNEREEGSEKEHCPIDVFLNSNRMEIDPENSPRLLRRRGGAIAYPDDKDRRERKKNRVGSDSLETNRAGSRFQDSSQDYTDHSFNKIGARKQSGSDSEQIQEKRTNVKGRETEDLVKLQKKPQQVPERQHSAVGSVTSQAKSTHIGKSESGSPGVCESSSKGIHTTSQIDPFMDELPPFIHPHLKESTNNMPSVKTDSNVILPFPKSESIQDAESDRSRKKIPKPALEKDTKDKVLSERGRLGREKKTDIAGKENTARIEQSPKSHSKVAVIGDLGSVPERDNNFKKKDRSMNEIKDERETKNMEVSSKDKRRKIEGNHWHTDTAVQRERNPSDVNVSDEDENAGSRIPALSKDGSNGSLKHVSEAAVRTRREDARWHPERTRRNISYAIRPDDDDVENRKYRSRSPQEVSELSDIPRQEESPAKKDWMNISDVSAADEEGRLDNRVEKRLRKPDLSVGYRSRPIKDTNVDEDDEAAESFVRVHEKQKYAGFVRRSGRGAKKVSPVKSSSLGNDGKDEVPQDEDFEERKTDSRNKRVNATTSQHDDQMKDFDSLIRGNPIEVNMDDSNEEKPASSKKGILNLFSCIGGKSSSAARTAEKYKKARPTAYYEEGEKRKIKKLSREKGKEEKSLHYFEKSEEQEKNSGADESVRTPDDKTAQDPSSMPSSLLPNIHRSERHQKGTTPFQPSTSLSTFTDPAEALASLEGEASLYDEDDDNSHRLKSENITHYDKTSKVAKKTELTTFMSFGKPVITASHTEPVFSKSGRSKKSELENAATVIDKDDAEQIRKLKLEEKLEMQSTTEEIVMPSELDTAHASLEGNIKEDWRHGDIVSRQSSSSGSSESDITPNVEGAGKDVSFKRHLIPEIRLSDSVDNLLPTASTEVEDFVERMDTSNDVFSSPTEILYSDREYSSFHLNSSAPAHFNIDQEQSSEQKLVFDPARDYVNGISESHQLDSPYDPSTSFDTADLQHRRQHRTVSFDGHLLQRHISEASLGSESTTSRPRSTSSVSNPLIYEPWRVKADRKKRSLSVNEMLYARGVVRPRRTHSVGEVYKSTVASSVAKRRTRARPSGDITSRMYQPRQHHRTHSLLGDTSFGSLRPTRQRSFSGFDHTTRSPDPSVTAVTVKRSESARQTSANAQIVEELERKNVEKSISVHQQKLREGLGEDKPASPSKSDTLKSADSASGGETLEERSSKEGSPTKEKPSPTKEKKKKKKFRIPSFSKKKSKESKESAT